MITATLQDDVGTLQLPLIQVPLSEETLENAVDVVTLDNNMYTDFEGAQQKRLWVFPYGYMKEEDYNAVKSFYDRQFTLFQYPQLSIPHYSIAGVYVRMFINTKEVFNNCGDIQNLKLSFRETSALPDGGS